MQLVPKRISRFIDLVTNVRPHRKADGGRHNGGMRAVSALGRREPVNLTRTADHAEPPDLEAWIWCCPSQRANSSIYQRHLWFVLERGIGPTRPMPRISDCDSLLVSNREVDIGACRTARLYGGDTRVDSRFGQCSTDTMPAQLEIAAAVVQIACAHGRADGESVKGVRTA